MEKFLSPFMLECVLRGVLVAEASAEHSLHPTALLRRGLLHRVTRLENFGGDSLRILQVIPQCW